MTTPIEAHDGLIAEVRDRFAHVESCPFTGPRVFFENAGGALTLKSVVETTARYAAVPDNQGRANAASAALNAAIDRARADARRFFNAEGGQVILGESGTELLFRLIREACLGAPEGGHVLGSSVEHPASRSAARRWAAESSRPYVEVPHDSATGGVAPEDYARLVTPETRVATILHTSPVTGIGNDIAGITAAIRAVAPEALVIVDGIQHACHGGIDIDGADVDGYVISPYKVFSRHGYGVAWASDRLADLPHDTLAGGPGSWELGTRDTGAYATFSDVVAYFDWLGGAVSGAEAPRARLEAAAGAIAAQEKMLCDAALFGTDNLRGLAEMPEVTVLGGAENARREGLVTFAHARLEATEIVERLNAEGIRTHTRKADHYSGNVLDPLGLGSAVRVSFCHYNTRAEVAALLSALARMT
ncbi:aminotransferase class V-fold PLP-dependent enzyme [Roseivivax sp. GX 12232]|uniref:aminotransferase class V-fold PLP-dependent enzyme n=1 Tax=Roseivivax sp. GX 12232 TaxID=2900547 RepID=UPI001E425DC2|nr:aminotransferase class V-fold PLP-dependent enzyme [Roseivivax sp. GX 12232]MCE0504391.1 aminotransferase class V-fold PLP-dependent enzyme [Roseivivax sp. GX 12232]